MLLTDEYYGEPSSSSLHLESGLAPFQAEDGRSVDGTGSFSFRISRTELGHHASVRKYQQDADGPPDRESFPARWADITLKIQCRRSLFPVRYENAFGGSFADPKSGEVVKWEANPVGTGYFAPNENAGHCQSATDSATGQKTDSVLASGWKLLDWGRFLRHGLLVPTGLGRLIPCGKELAGPTSRKIFPSNSTTLRQPGSRFRSSQPARKTVELINLTPERSIWFSLPGFELATLMRFEDGNLVPGPVFLGHRGMSKLRRQRVYLDVARSLSCQCPVARSGSQSQSRR